jgi:hypothetical protein
MKNGGVGGGQRDHIASELKHGGTTKTQTNDNQVIISFSDRL